MFGAEVAAVGRLAYRSLDVDIKDPVRVFGVGQEAESVVQKCPLGGQQGVWK